MEAADLVFEGAAPSARALEIMALIEEARGALHEDPALMAQIEHLAQRLVMLGKGLLELDLPEAAEEIMRHEIAVGVEATEGFLAALEIVERALTEGDRLLLDAAREMVAQADESLHEAVRLNGENRARLEALYLDSSLML
ncbi:MAG: hypothetical protein EB084_25765 [Proteobacteria bacterium]|nr:hypothetical protein [Pseudomonadota bacterium]